MALHPFDPLTPAELTKGVAILKANHPGKLLHIKTGERLEPVSTNPLYLSLPTLTNFFLLSFSPKST